MFVFILYIPDDRGGTWYIPKRLMCLMRRHRYTYRNFHGRTVKCYYCVTCRKPGNFPYLKPLQGGRKIWKDDFKF